VRFDKRHDFRKNVIEHKICVLINGTIFGKTLLNIKSALINSTIFGKTLLNIKSVLINGTIFGKNVIEHKICFF